MQSLFRLLRVLSLVAGLGLLSVSAAQSQTVIVGNSTQGNFFPFSADYAGRQYQQIYSAAAFSGPVIITQIGFSSTSAPGAFRFTGALGLGTTAGSPSSPGNSFTANKGADFRTVFSGAQTATLMTNNTFDLLFDIAPFVYNPASGNLVLDVVTDTVTSGDNVAFAASQNSLEGRLFTVPGSEAVFNTQNFGLRTQFVVTPNAQAAPEPGSAALLLPILGAAGMVARRRKQQASALGNKSRP